MAEATIKRISRKSLPRDTVTLARYLLGKVLVRELPVGAATGRIVETEAYIRHDPACHAYRGLTDRNRSLFLDCGHAYVYLCYGTSFMLNVSSETGGVGTGVLLRALEPLNGIETMQAARGGAPLRDIARGPGRLTAAMSIDRRFDGLDICADRQLWIGDDGAAAAAVGESVRIGLTKAADARLRYFLLANRFVSGPKSLNV